MRARAFLLKLVGSDHNRRINMPCDGCKHLVRNPSGAFNKISGICFGYEEPKRLGSLTHEKSCNNQSVEPFIELRHLALAWARLQTEVEGKWLAKTINTKTVERRLLEKFRAQLKELDRVAKQREDNQNHIWMSEVEDHNSVWSGRGPDCRIARAGSRARLSVAA